MRERPRGVDPQRGCASSAAAELTGEVRTIDASAKQR